MAWFHQRQIPHQSLKSTAWVAYRAHGSVNSMSILILKYRHGLVSPSVIGCRLFRLSYNWPRLWVLPMYWSSSTANNDSHAEQCFQLKRRTENMITLKSRFMTVQAMNKSFNCRLTTWTAQAHTGLERIKTVWFLSKTNHLGPSIYDVYKNRVFDPSPVHMHPHEPDPLSLVDVHMRSTWNTHHSFETASTMTFRI